VKGKPINVLIVGISISQRIPYKKLKRPKLNSEKSFFEKRNKEAISAMRPTNKTNNPNVIFPKSILSVSILKSVLSARLAYL
jgi:hypothetical protein